MEREAGRAASAGRKENNCRPFRMSWEGGGGGSNELGEEAINDFQQ